MTGSATVVREREDAELVQKSNISRVDETIVQQRPSEGDGVTSKKLWRLSDTPDDVSGTLNNIRYGSLIVICLLVIIGVITRYGIGAFNPQFVQLATAVKHSAHYNVDPTTILLAHSPPILFPIFRDIYDIPFYHLLSAILAKFFVACGFLVLTWKVTRSILACFLAQMMLFGLADFLVLDVNIPLGYISFGVRRPLSLNFREFAMAFAIIATIFFVNRRYLLSSLLLTFGFYLHPFNTMAFFLSFNMALAISFLVKEDKLEFIHAALKLSVPFLVLISPYLYLWMNAKMLSEITPISSSLWWKFILKNEPDDASFLFHITRGGYWKEFFLTVVAFLLYVFLKSEKPLTKSSLKAFIRNKQDSVLPLLLAPWAVALFVAVWEGILIYRFPDFLNDLLIPVQLRRSPTVSAFLYITILAGFISRVVLVLTETSLVELLGWERRKGRQSTSGDRVTMLSFDVVLGVGLSLFLAIFVLLRGSSKGVNLRDYWNFEHMREEYFLLKREKPIYSFEGKSSQAEAIPHAAFLEVCSFVRNKTPVSAAFFNPTYIGWFLAYCERQRFLSEEDDGSYATHNRRLATVYLKRFSDIHKGLTYDDFPSIVFNGGEAYSIMRQRYLSLNGSDIERLKMLYPGYKYFLTEVGHTLPYGIIYRNDYFLVYDLEQKETAQ